MALTTLPAVPRTGGSSITLTTAPALPINASGVGAPTITVQPASQSVAPGANVTFTVTATGSGLTYQWYKDGSPISGANAASYTKNGVAGGDAGDYSVRVTNAGGFVDSSDATLTVTSSTYPVYVAYFGPAMPSGGTFTAAQIAALASTNKSSRAGTYEVNPPGSNQYLVIAMPSSFVSGIDIKEGTTFPLALNPNDNTPYQSGLDMSGVVSGLTAPYSVFVTGNRSSGGFLVTNGNQIVIA